jgi:DinB superfamily
VDQDEIEALLESYEAAPARIAAAAVGHGARLAEPPAPGEWSPRDILAHIRAADEILSPRLIQILVRDEPPLPSFDERRWAEVMGYATLDFDRLQATFAYRRAEMARVLRQLPPEGWQRVGIHEERGPRTVLRLLRVLVEHEAEHVAQIEALLA